jgi:DNA-damage-inducible protein D
MRKTEGLLMDDQQHAASHVSPFAAMRKVDENGNEYWSARELYKLLAYSTWQKFQYAIEQAKIACAKSGYAVSDHFNLQVNMIKVGKGAKRKTEDYRLSRYSCYLIVQNADPSKPIVALGQTYFAYQTRRQEIADELALSTLPEDQKRLILRSTLTTFHPRLAEAAQQAGVIDPQDFATFYDHGYMGLYGGLRENDIHVRKSLTEDQQKISDYMGSEELGANIFRATQTDAKLRRDQVHMKEQANSTHYQVGQEVRETIKRLGGTMPEDLPTPAESIQELQRKDQKQVQQRQQPSLFEKSPDDND